MTARSEPAGSPAEVFALYDPLWTTAIRDPRDFALALTGFVLLTAGKIPSWVVVLLLAAGGAGLALWG